MSRLTNFFALGEYYHIYNRGTEKRKIFLSNHDRNRFLSLLYLCNCITPIHRSNLTRDSLHELLNILRQDTLVDIGAYCLMPNHFHLLLKERTENGISTFMQKLSTAYTMYFNRLHERNGALFQGRFKAKHLDTDNYLKYIFAYIHLNLEGKFKEHVYSSYPDYSIEVQRIPEGRILNKSEFPEYFQSPKDFSAELEEWLAYGKVEP